MSDDFKKTSEVDPPIEKREGLVIEKFNKSLDATKEGLKDFEKSQKSDLTTDQQNAINFLNSIKPINPDMSKASLESLKDKIEKASSILPGNSAVAANLLSAIDSVINQASNKQWTTDEVKASLKMAETNKLQLAKQAEEVDKLWNSYSDAKFQDKLKEFDARDEERNEKLKPFLTKENLTEKDLKEAKKHQLTDEEIEERKKYWNVISKTYHGLTKLTIDLTAESKRLGQEIKQLNELEHKEEHHIKHIEKLLEYKYHNDENLKKYNKDLSEIKRDYNTKDQKLKILCEKLEEVKHSPNQLLIKEISEHLKVHEKDHEKDLANYPDREEAKNYVKIKEALKKYDDKLAAAEKKSQSKVEGAATQKTGVKIGKEAESTSAIKKAADEIKAGFEANKTTVKNNSMRSARRNELDGLGR